MLITFTVSLLLLTILVVLIALEYKKTYKWLIVIIPFLLFNLAFGWYNIQKLAGDPSTNQITENSQLLHAVTARPYIYVMVWEPNAPKPKLFQLPYSQRTEQQLQKSMEMMKQGQRVMIKRPADGDFVDEYIFYPWRELVESQGKK